MHPDFWIALGTTIGMEQNQPLDCHTLAQWVSLLLASDPMVRHDIVLPRLSERCAEARLTGSLLEIFDAMSKGRLVLRSYNANAVDDAATFFVREVEPPYDHHLLNPVWNDRLKPMLKRDRRTSTYDLSPEFGEAAQKRFTSGKWRTRIGTALISAGEAINSHTQNSRPTSIDVIIDVARDCLEFLAGTQPAAAAIWCERLMRADVPILRRLAVHNLSTRKDLTPDEKINWLLKGKRLFDFAAHREILEALKGSIRTSVRSNETLS